MLYDHDDALRAGFRRYRIVKVYDDGTQQLVDLKGMKTDLPEGLWRPQDHGFSSVPMEGGDGYVVPMGGRGDRGLYVDAGHERYRPRNLKPGETAIYNGSGDIIKVLEASSNFTHSKKITLNIGKGQDVSDPKGSKDPDTSGEMNVSVVLDGTDSVTITRGEAVVKLEAGKTTVTHPTMVNVICPLVNLGAEGGKFVKLEDGSNATKVKAI